ncbi:MAG: ATP-binding cassette domain-containing protein [Fibrobacter sp.]|nr:ATP-binding cassette domain-containing protein [Fibrobacter sp.]
MSNFKLYKRMFSYLAVYWSWFLLSIILSFLVVNFEALSLWFGGSLIQTIFEPQKTVPVRPELSIETINAFLKYYTSKYICRGTPMQSLLLVCAMLAVTFILKNILVYLKSLLMAKLNLVIVRDMRNQLYDKILRLPLSYFDRSKSGETISLVINDVQSINASMTGTFDKLFVEPMRIIFFITMVFLINFKLALAVLFIIPVLGTLINLIGKTVRRRSKRVLEYSAGILSILQETITGIRAVKMFNMNEEEHRRFKNENQKFIHHSYKSTSIGAISSPLTEVLGMFVVVILLLYGGQQVLAKDGFGADDFIRFLFFLFSAFTPMKALTVIVNTIQQGFAAADRVFKLLDLPVEKLVQPVDLKQVPTFNDSIKFNDVTFSYPGTTTKVLSEINFTMKKGSIIALVGSSGAGKSTILDLLPRFYELDSGTITIDGKDITTFDLTALRHLFGIVSQETVLFNDTIYNNIAYGTFPCSNDRVLDAAKAANALEFIEKLPHGLDTIIGERGVMLSGGQRQRISIARALLRNPPVLILDEATSALDTESERLVQSAINNLIENRTALIVAHRLSTIRHADLILVLETGKIVEQGTHEELLALNKRYKYFHDIQFAPSVTPSSAS